jgi:hypothetical protein
MSPERRFHAAIVAVTIAAMSAGLLFVIPLLPGDLKVAEVLISILTGMGLRELLIGAVNLALSKSTRLKKLILGRSYVEGLWAGYYTTPNGYKLNIVVVRQDWSTVSLNGRAFDSGKRPYGQWRSLTASIDGDQGVLHTIFTGDLASGHYESVVTLQFDEYDPPRAMRGLIVDSVAADKAGRAWIRLYRADGDHTDAGLLETAEDWLKKDPAGYVLPPSSSADALKRDDASAY